MQVFGITHHSVPFVCNLLRKSRSTVLSNLFVLGQPLPDPAILKRKGVVLVVGRKLFVQHLQALRKVPIVLLFDTALACSAVRNLILLDAKEKRPLEYVGCKLEAKSLKHTLLGYSNPTKGVLLPIVEKQDVIAKMLGIVSQSLVQAIMMYLYSISNLERRAKQKWVILNWLLSDTQTIDNLIDLLGPRNRPSKAKDVLIAQLSADPNRLKNFRFCARKMSSDGKGLSIKQLSAAYQIDEFDLSYLKRMLAGRKKHGSD